MLHRTRSGLPTPDPPLTPSSSQLHSISLSAMIGKVSRVKVSVPVLPPYFVRAGRERGPEVVPVLHRRRHGPVRSTLSSLLERRLQLKARSEL